MNRKLLIGLLAIALGVYLLYRKGGLNWVKNVSVRIGAGSVFGEVDVLNLISEIKAEYPFLSDVPELLVLAIAKTESSLQPSVTGSQGEFGLMQVMPMTWAWIFNKFGLYEERDRDHYDPKTNLLAGMLVLYDYNRSLGGDWGATVHAYNVGVGGYLNGNRAELYAARVAENMGLA